jgi:hypothetical protein
VDKYQGDTDKEWWEDAAETRAVVQVEFSSQDQLEQAARELTAAGVNVDQDDWHLDLYLTRRQVESHHDRHRKVYDRWAQRNTQLGASAREAARWL